ncbi:MAG: DUF6250 domain-containing protein [Breznakibacter sp.]
MKYLLAALTGICLFSACHQRNNDGKTLLFADNFDSLELSPDWIIEMDSLPHSSVRVGNGKLTMDTKGGVTIWFNHLLNGNLQIEYTRKVVMENGPNDRVSDLNQFWMAVDPRNPDLFTRKGKFGEYDSLRLYYVGVGGNTNTTTRFRRYDGHGTRALLQENNTPENLLRSNHAYHIKITVQNGESQFWVDGVCVFRYTDPAPFGSGYFGFRSTWSRHEIDNFKVFRLQ